MWGTRFSGESDLGHPPNHRHGAILCLVPTLRQGNNLYTKGAKENAKFREGKCDKQIPFGNDNKNSKGKYGDPSTAPLRDFAQDDGVGD
jgi:hypothetical protein